MQSSLGGVAACLGVIYFHRWPYGKDRMFVSRVLSPSVGSGPGFELIDQLAAVGASDLLDGELSERPEPGFHCFVLLGPLGRHYHRCRSLHYDLVRAAGLLTKLSSSPE